MRIPHYATVFHAMRYGEYYSIEEIGKSTGIHYRAAAYGMRQLVKRGLVSTYGRIADKRKKLFKTKQRELPLNWGLK